MRNRRSWRPARRVALGLVVVAIAMNGCGGKEEIRTYRVATGDAPAPAAAEAPAAEAAAERGEPTDRMLAAVIGSADRVWFLKVVDRLGAVSSREDAIREVFESFRVEADRQVWSLPDGWSQEDESGMRLATLRSPADEDGRVLELSITGLPKTGAWRPQLLGNVNRWRGQMGQPRLTAGELDEAVSPLGEDDAERVVVDITGWFSGGMSPSSAVTPPAPPPAPPPAADALTYETPEGWVDQPGSAMRKASFKTPAGSEVTAFVFAAGGGMSDPVGNVNRWRSQVGLAPTTKEELEAASETLDVAGGAATYVELLGEENATLAAMSERGPRIWFFKLTGPTEAVSADRQAFRDWLASLDF